MITLRGSCNYLWDVGKPLGQGATSMVYKGRNKSTGEEVAVKVFTQAGNMRPMEVQMREYRVMSKLQHRNIVPLLAIEEEQNTRNRVIVMQLTDHGSLFTMLEDPQNAYGLPEEEFLIVLEHITAGMKYLRDNGIVHRDIKPGNILRYIGEDGRSVYRLTDFGAAKEIESEEEQFMSLYGTEEYLHPDIYERAVLRNPDRRQFTSKVDLWSLGVTFFHVATGQLPFKPFGGRKNKQKMFEITRHKESGVIMGVQHMEGGPIDWSRELPQTCKLSNGLKLLITPVLARLLESNPTKAWNFDTFFKEVEQVVKKTVINVFCPQIWTNLRVYVNKECNLTALQELIAQQTEVGSASQLLVFDGQLLRECVQPMLPVASYPEGITQQNPILCFSKNVEDSWRFPLPVIKEFPKFTSSFTPEDYSIAKLCAAIACYIKREVAGCYGKQELVRRSVHLYIHELYHECEHLVDYHVFLEKNCNSVLKWKDNFLRTFRRELKMLKMLVENSNLQMGYVVTELEEFHHTCSQDITQMAAQITGILSDVSDQLSRLKDEHIQKKVLRKQWNDSIGCTKDDRWFDFIDITHTKEGPQETVEDSIGCTIDDRCVAKVNVVLEHVLKIKTHFHEDRKKPNLNFNEEQIHKYEKNKLSENCIKIKSLLFDHCFNGAKDQFSNFNAWYRHAWEVRYHSETIEKKLLELADSLANFVSELNNLCLKYNEQIERYIRNIDEKFKEREFISVRPEIPSSSGSSYPPGSAKQQRHRLLQNLLEGLNENQQSVIDLKRELDTNTKMLHNFTEVLQIAPTRKGRSDSPF